MGGAADESFAVEDCREFFRIDGAESGNLHGVVADLFDFLHGFRDIFGSLGKLSERVELSREIFLRNFHFFRSPCLGLS